MRSKKSDLHQEVLEQKAPSTFQQAASIEKRARGLGPMQPVVHKTKGPDPLFQWIQPLYRKQLALGQAAD